MDRSRSPYGLPVGQPIGLPVGQPIGSPQASGDEAAIKAAQKAERDAEWARQRAYEEARRAQNIVAEGSVFQQQYEQNRAQFLQFKQLQEQHRIANSVGTASQFAPPAPAGHNPLMPVSTGLGPLAPSAQNPLLPGSTGGTGLAPLPKQFSNPLLPSFQFVGAAPAPVQPVVQDTQVHMATTPTTWTDAAAQKAPSLMPQALRLNVPQPGLNQSAHVSLQQLQHEKEQQVHDKAQQNVERLKALWEEKRSAESKEGYFEATLGQTIQGERSMYTIMDAAPLGVGTFSSVFVAADGDQKLKALKVIRSQAHFRNYASREVSIMIKIRESASKDEEGSAYCLMLRDHFMYEEHLCIVMDKLGTSLRIFGRQPLDKVISFSKQLLLSLRYLHDGTGLIHCDVKPDNLLVRHDGLAIKLCDFGTSGFAKEKQTVDELQPLFYRAPEVLIGAPRGRKIDIWSTGCTIFELAVGRILYRDCNSVRDCMEKTMRLRGAIPEHMRKQGRLTSTFFSERGFHPEAGGPQTLQSFKAKPMYQELAGFVDFGSAKGLSTQDLATSQLSRLIGSTTVLGAAGKQVTKTAGEGEKNLEFLANLIESCMNVDPALRISAADAVKVSVFKDVRPPPDAIVEDAPPLPAESAPPMPAPPERRAPARPASVPTVELVSAD